MSEEPSGPDYSRLVGTPWFRKESLKKWAAIGAIVLFALLWLRKGPSAPQVDTRAAKAQMTDLVDKARQFVTRQKPTETPAVVTQTAVARSQGGGVDLEQELRAERRHHRAEAYSAPIFSGGSSRELPNVVEAKANVPEEKPAPQAPAVQSPAEMHHILPGTVVEAALDTALESTLSGVVLAHLTRPVRDPHLFGPVLLPEGTRLVGMSETITNWNQPRLKVTFNLAVLPDGRQIALDKLNAMNQMGETGLSDKVNNHWLSTVGIAGAVGVIEGLSLGASGRSVLDTRTEVMTGIAQQTGQEGTRILDRYLNRPPTVKVNPGSRIRIIFPSGVDVPGEPEVR